MKGYLRLLMFVLIMCQVSDSMCRASEWKSVFVEDNKNEILLHPDPVISAKGDEFFQIKVITADGWRGGKFGGKKCFFIIKKASVVKLQKMQDQKKIGKTHIDQNPTNFCTVRWHNEQWIFEFWRRKALAEKKVSIVRVKGIQTSMTDNALSSLLEAMKNKQLKEE